MSKSNATKILKLLCDGPATSRQIADALGLEFKVASSCLSRLGVIGVLEREETLTPTGGRPAYLWRLAKHRLAA